MTKGIYRVADAAELATCARELDAFETGRQFLQEAFDALVVSARADQAADKPSLVVAKLRDLRGQIRTIEQLAREKIEGLEAALRNDSGS